MQTKQYKTNLHCESCLTKLRPVLDGATGIDRWDVNLASPDKVLSVTGDGVGPEAVRPLVAKAGFQVLGEIEQPHHHHEPEEKPTSYYPLALVLAFVLGGAALLQARAGSWSWMGAMSDFMGLFFVAFAFFKLLDVPGFASSYSSYDVIARRWLGWGYVYPFVELGLGVAYLLAWQPVFINALTLVVAGVGSVGVAQTLLAKRKIRCACLGTGFNLPMSVVSLTEDVGMAAMAAAMLFALWGG